MVARIQAWRIVSTLEPTEVPKLLATSLAPTPKAKKNDTTNPTVTIHIRSGSIGIVVMVTTDVNSDDDLPR